MFADKAVIHVKSGKGGNGCTSFYRGKLVRHPRPDGGNGGRGGDIIVKADRNIHTLLDFQYRRHFKADSGSNGSSNHKKGRDAEPCIIRVPPGTIIKDADTKDTLRDLSTADQEVIVLKGGNGGRGNTKRGDAAPGGESLEQDLFLELKLIADVGIIGYPNAGKSTLISRVSKAHPKIASYPFTTTVPVLGIVELSKARRFVACEIPGIIEGAHSGKGLGFEFLRHMERTRVLVHLIDSAACEGRDPYQDYKRLNKELELYSKALAKKPQVIALNKMDLPQAEEGLGAFKKKTRRAVYPVSGAAGTGIKQLLEAVWKHVK